MPAIVIWSILKITISLTPNNYGISPKRQSHHLRANLFLLRISQHHSLTYCSLPCWESDMSIRNLKRMQFRIYYRNPAVTSCFRERIPQRILAFPKRKQGSDIGQSHRNYLIFNPNVQMPKMINKIHFKISFFSLIWLASLS